MSADATPAAAGDPIHARLLRAEAEDVLPILHSAWEQDFERTTVCDEWTVADLVTHTIAMLRAATKPEVDAAGFTPERNARDVAALRGTAPPVLITDLEDAYELAAAAPASPALDTIALAVWLHGGDIRDAWNIWNPYRHGGLPDAITLLAAHSARLQIPPVDVTLADASDLDVDPQVCLGDPSLPASGWLRTDAAGMFRIVARRRVGLVERDVVGVDLDALVMFR